MSNERTDVSPSVSLRLSLVFVENDTFLYYNVSVLRRFSETTQSYRRLLQVTTKCEQCYACG